MAFGLDDIIAEGLKIINKYIPDSQAQVNAQIEMMKIKQLDAFKEMETALQEKQMQADINKVEAASDKVFVAGWRPFIGWICGVGLGLQVIIFPLVATVAAAIGISFTLPEMPVEVLMVNLTGMLGLAGARSWEKIKGVRNGGA